MPYAIYSTLFGVTKKLYTFKDRIAYVVAELEKKGVRQSELAKSLGVKPATVTEWIKGRSKRAQPETLFKIEDRYGYSARWLATGEEPITVQKLDPTDTAILNTVEKLSPDAKNAVQAFVEFQLTR